MGKLKPRPRPLVGLAETLAGESTNCCDFHQPTSHARFISEALQINCRAQSVVSVCLVGKLKPRPRPLVGLAETLAGESTACCDFHQPTSHARFISEALQINSPAQSSPTD